MKSTSFDLFTLMNLAILLPYHLETKAPFVDGDETWLCGICCAQLIVPRVVFPTGKVRVPVSTLWWAGPALMTGHVFLGLMACTITPPPRMPGICFITLPLCQFTVLVPYTTVCNLFTWGRLKWNITIWMVSYFLGLGVILEFTAPVNRFG